MPEEEFLARFHYKKVLVLFLSGFSYTWSETKLYFAIAVDVEITSSLVHQLSEF